jgi:hypothetical protein
MAKITFQYKKFWINYLLASSFHVYIDGKKVDKVTIGKTKSFELTGGNHNLQVKCNPFQLQQSPVESNAFNDNKETSYKLTFTIFGIASNLLSFAILVIFLFMVRKDLFIGSFAESIRSFHFLDICALLCLIAYFYKERFIKMEQV